MVGDVAEIKLFRGIKLKLPKLKEKIYYNKEKGVKKREEIKYKLTYHVVFKDHMTRKRVIEIYNGSFEKCVPELLKLRKQPRERYKK